MNDNLKMVGRYAITAAVAYAVGKGWVKADQSSDITNALIQIGGAIAALAPAFYAWFKVDNTPKT